MKIIVCDDVGQIKVVQTTPGVDTTVKPSPTSIKPRIKSYLTPDSRNAIQASCIIDHWRGHKNVIAVAQASGSILLLDTQTGDVLHSYIPGYEGNPTAVGSFISLSYTASLCVLASCTSAGYASFLYTGAPDAATKSGDKTAALGDDGVKLQYYAFPVNPDAKLEVFRVHPSRDSPVQGVPGAVAWAGKENELEVWISGVSDSGEVFWTPHFKAKNVKNDKLNLRVPVWITDLQFLPDRQDGAFAVIVTTQHSSIRVYHPGSARRPVLEHREVCKVPILSILLAPYETNSDKEHEVELPKVILSTADGQLFLYDMLEKQSLGNYASAGTGSILSTDVRSIRFSSGNNTNTHVLAAVGADRYLLAWNATSRKLLSRVWMKSRGTGVALLSSDMFVIEDRLHQDSYTTAHDNVATNSMQVDKADSCSSDDEQDKYEDGDIWDDMDDANDSGSAQNEDMNPRGAVLAKHDQGVHPRLRSETERTQVEHKHKKQKQV